MGYVVTNDTIKHLHEVEFLDYDQRHLSFCELLNDQIPKTDTPRKIECNGAKRLNAEAMSFI